MSEQTPNTQPRIFKIGATTIQADDSMANLDNEQIRDLLKRTYPEVAHATVREITLEDGTVAVHYIPQAGKKG